MFKDIEYFFIFLGNIEIIKNGKTMSEIYSLLIPLLR